MYLTSVRAPSRQSLARKTRRKLPGGRLRQVSYTPGSIGVGTTPLAGGTLLSSYKQPYDFSFFVLGYMESLTLELSGWARAASENNPLE